MLEHDQAICIYKAISANQTTQLHTTTLVMLSMKQAITKEQYVLKNAIRLKMDYAEAFTNLGGVFYKINQLDQAISVYKKRSHLNRTMQRPIITWALLFKNGQIQHSDYDRGKAIKLNPNFSEAYNNLANILCSANAREFSEPLAKAYQDIINFPNIVQPEKIVSIFLFSNIIKQ